MASDDRRERLAAALRANLKRRKARLPETGASASTPAERPEPSVKA